MNSDLTPGRCGAPHPPGGALRPYWRAASNAHAALFADAGEQAPACGEIWTIRNQTNTPDQELLLAVIIVVSTNTATVVPLSSDVNWATEWDLLLPTQTLGYRAITQAKLAGSVTLDQLDQRLSTLMPESQRELKQLLDAAQAGLAIPPEHLPLGPWVFSENDQRLSARLRCAERLRHYLTPLFDDPIAEWQSLGSLLARGSRATGVDLAMVIDDPRWVSKLQADQLDPFASLPPRKMAQVLKTLRIGWTARVRDALYRLASQYTPSEIPQATVFGRRQGKRASRRRSTSSQREGNERAASEYVDAVEQELRKL